MVMTIRHVCNDCEGDIVEGVSECPSAPRPSGADVCALVIADFTEPSCVKGNWLSLYALIADDLRARQAKGIATYGDTLRVDTDIDDLRYEYEELLDACNYARKSWERARGTTREDRDRNRYLRRMEDVIDLRREMFERDGC